VSAPPHWKNEDTIASVSSPVVVPVTGKQTGINGGPQHIHDRPSSIATGRPIGEPDKHSKSASVSSLDLISSVSFTSDNQMDVPFPEKAIKSMKGTSLPSTKNYSRETGEEIISADQHKRTILVPSGSKTLRNSADEHKFEEIMVSINIGRIEVRADPTSETIHNPAHTFSPSLSLADYLKQRSKASIR
jgi:hypothetical protein